MHRGTPVQTDSTTIVRSPRPPKKFLRLADNAILAEPALVASTSTGLPRVRVDTPRPTMAFPFGTIGAMASCSDLVGPYAAAMV